MTKHFSFRCGSAAILLLMLTTPALAPAAEIAPAEFAPATFLQHYCYECHDGSTKEGGLDLAALQFAPQTEENFARWVKIYDRVAAGEMPPKESKRPEAKDAAAFIEPLRETLLSAEQTRLGHERRTLLRRMTRAEYENTIRDLFDMPGIALISDLPADGSAHGFDKNSDALDISHVNMAKYVAAADHTLDMAIADRPRPPKSQTHRVSLASGAAAHITMNGDGVLLRNKRPDPNFPPAGEYGHFDQGAHEKLDVFNPASTVGLFRHEDEAFAPYFIRFISLYPGRYRLRASLWSFQWDKGQVLPSRGTEAARLSIVQLTADGRGGGHPSYLLGYYDAPSLHEQVHEIVHWLNPKETVGFNTASLAPVANYNRKGRAMAFTGPGIACDWLEVEGPLHDIWPPASHRRLFGELPIVEFVPAEHPGIRPPAHKIVKREIGAGKNEPDPIPGIWTVQSDDPLADADRLLADFLPKAFRRPVAAEVRATYVAKVAERLQAGDCFELAMRWVYRAALCSPDFLYIVENTAADQQQDSTNPSLARQSLDDYALASRLSYFFWNSQPDERLRELAAAGTLHQPTVLRAQVERLLGDQKSQRFVEDFLGQWLKLRQIAANDPDRKLYPEFSSYLQDSMLAETRAFFRELIDKDLSATHLVQSDFAMLNEKLAQHYGIEGVSGSQIRRVALPAGSPRGPFLTQAAILKVTANGTTTSPVPRGAFVLARLLGKEPDPPPPNVPAIEPDVQGAKTIREQLDKHRADVVCASCHAQMDPPGFALESFDVIGGFRERYRSIGVGDTAPRGNIDPRIPISFKLGLPVDSSGILPDGRKFGGIAEFQTLMAADSHVLLKNLAEQLLIYSTGRDIAFGDRAAVAEIVAKTQADGGGVRTLLQNIVASPLFQSK